MASQNAALTIGMFYRCKTVLQVFYKRFTAVLRRLFGKVGCAPFLKNGIHLRRREDSGMGLVVR